MPAATTIRDLNKTKKRKIKPKKRIFMQCGEHAGTSGSSPESLSFLAVLMRALGRDEKIF